ncbi:hypothetical protein CTI12_AA130340 [Artemisia annua]|uniref:Uncharacterized protein n=1 Tax=Artemisia annua TaxID=35608 RepID=A0A2U1PNY8_ARTAN|nr:hypothetical protein CTI12_AA130340 [Artemisia annua]
MTTALGPGKFYGSSLPRPRIYTDIKYNTDRVDPPVSVLDPFMSWAEEAHWSMGGLSSKRHRLQGRIEGDIEKIRNHIETSIQKTEEPLSPKFKKFKNSDSKKAGKSPSSPAVPPAPIANKRKEAVCGVDDASGSGKKWLVRKLSDEFDRVETKKVEIEGEGVAARTRGRKADVTETVKSGLKGRKRLRKVGDLKVVV